MSDEVMEPLTDTMLKRKTSRRSNNDTRDNNDSSLQQKLPSKTPDKKKGFLSKIAKSKGDQQKKRTAKPDPTANSIRNPSNHLDLFETQNEKRQDTSPRVPLGSYEDSNDSDFLIDNPSSPGAQPPAAKRSLPEPNPDTVSLPLSTSSSQPPFHNESCEETNPVFSGHSPWCHTASPSCHVDQAPGISHSWEPYRSSPISQIVLSSYDSNTATHKSVSTIFSSDRMFPELNCDLENKNQSEVYNSVQTSDPPNEFTSHKRSDSMGGTQPFKDPFIITESEFVSFSSFFQRLDPQDGLLFGDQARNFFLRSDLPNEELSKIWMLSDVDGDLKLTFAEFCIAMKLVRNRKKGIPLPAEVPPSLFNCLALLTDTYLLSSDTHLDQQADPLSYSSNRLPQYSNLLDEQTPVPSNLFEAPSLATATLEDIPSSVPQDTQDSTDTEDLEETVTVDNYQIQDEIEDPIPKLSNSSVPTNYTDQIKTLFTPTPNPLPPPPTKTQMQQRSVLTPILSSYEIVQPFPRVEITPVVQMRSHTTDSSTCPIRRKDSCSGYIEGGEEPMILSLPNRGGTDPREMKSKKKISRKRPDRVSAVILIDKSENEESLVSLINNGEVRTINLTPHNGDEGKVFLDDLSQLSTTDNDVANEPEKANNESTPHSSPDSNRVKPVSQKKDSKMNLLKKKLMKRNKKATGSNGSLEKAGTQEPGSSKKNKAKKSSKKDKKKHKRSNSLEVNTLSNRFYGSQNDIHLPQKDDTRVPITALTELCRLYSPSKSVSTLSLSPSHNQDTFQPQNDYDSFDSTGSSDNIQSDDVVEAAPKFRTRKKRIDRTKRSLSSPECIMSTPPIPDAGSSRHNNNNNTFTEVDDKTPLHTAESAPACPASYEREMLTQRIHEMIAKCESLRSVNSQLTSELNQIRLQKNELAMQLRYHGPRNFL